MAITIIKHGRKVYKTVCPTCGCEFLYNDEDIGTDAALLSDPRFGFKCEFVICPDCNETINHGPTKKGVEG